LQLIVTDLDGTLLNSKHEISAENIEALKFAQKQGIEVAIATGRTYGNTLALCKKAGLKLHIISNNGSFVYTENGKMLMENGLDIQNAKNALYWLQDNNYSYSICTNRNFFMPDNTSSILTSDFENAKDIDSIWNRVNVKQMINSKILALDGLRLMKNVAEVFEQQVTIGHISVTTFDKDKFSKGKEYFSANKDLSVVTSESIIFDLMNNSTSKGNGLQYLINYLKIPFQDVMAIGDNYNDISMLERVGHSVAIGNAEETVKKICKHISLTNDLNGVAHIINQIIPNCAIPFINHVG